MKKLRILLFPFGIIYWLITWVRNFFYDIRFFKSYTAPIPVIAVGNLSTGGTGKSPQIEYLIRLLTNRYKVAILSRGYKRKSKGFVLATPDITVEELGDEPFQFFSKFPHNKVAVDANRTRGVRRLLQLDDPPKIILLDDAYQHRKVKATLYILITSYNNLYCDDFILPVGNLREPKNGSKRAEIIVVSKCPSNLPVSERDRVIERLNPSVNQKIFFTTINYDNFIYSASSKQSVIEVKLQKKILVAGIAKPELFFDFLGNKGDIFLKYPDHHNFSDKEITYIKQKAKGRIIITTEKDYARIKNKFESNKLFYLPIKTEFLADAKLFEHLIIEKID